MDAETFTDYVEKYRNTVFRVAYSYSGSLQDSEDITQEAFLKLYKSEEKFAADENVKAWLIRVASNEAKNFIRRNAVRRKEPISTSFRLLSLMMKELSSDIRALDSIGFPSCFFAGRKSCFMEKQAEKVVKRNKRWKDKILQNREKKEENERYIGLHKNNENF